MNNSNEEFYFNQLPLWPKFEIMINDEDGRIPVSRVESWESLQVILNDDFFRKRSKELVFRGQEDFRWGLIPSLGRLTKSGTIETKLAEKHKELFRLSIRGRVEDSNLLDDEIELWALGQHNGLQTPLLDWSYSPYIALFFAFERDDSLEDGEHSRAIYVLNKKALEELDEDLFIQPRRNDHIRLINQAGLFTISPRDTIDTLETHILTLLGDNAGVNMDDPDDVAYYICKIHIPNTNKIECMRHLRMMNIHHASLFPDLMGSSQYCNMITQEYSAHIEEEFVQVMVDTATKVLPTIEYEVVDSDFVYEYFRNTTKIFEGEAEIKTFSSVLGKKLSENLSVDWANRDSIISKLKNITRLELRKHGVAADSLNEVSEEFIMELLKLEKDKQQKEAYHD